MDEIQRGSPLRANGGATSISHIANVVTLAKAPVVVFDRRDVACRARLDRAAARDHSTTQGGAPLACAAAIATLRTIEEEGLVERCAAMGKFSPMRCAHLHRGARSGSLDYLSWETDRQRRRQGRAQ